MISMAQVHISLLPPDNQKKGEHLFSISTLERTATRAEEKIFNANGAILRPTVAGGFVYGSDDVCRLVLRPLEKQDYDKGYLDLLKQLTKIGEITPERFEERFSIMQKSPNLPSMYYVCVLEDFETSQVIGSASLILEYKFIRNLGIRGRIEDVVVDDKYRGKRLAKVLLSLLVELAKDVDCYKLSLECKDHLVTFYSKFGFIKEPSQNYMSQRFRE